jgi:glyoxylase-like metal-dependent hydrolase (beta-lactamase superfamily II)
LAVAGLVVAACAAVGWVGAFRTFAPRDDAISAVLPPAAVAVAPGVYLLGRTAPAAVYLVDTADGLVLIDSGIEADARRVKQQLAELRFDVKALTAILLTHAHADHSLGAGHLRSLSGAKVYAGGADAHTLRAGGPREAFFSTFHMPNLAPHATTVDQELVGDETLVFGDARLKVLATPGHTAGSVCYLLEYQGLRILFTGDVIQHLSQPREGDLGTYAAHLAPVYGGSARDYLASLQKLRALPMPDLVLPGHPQMDIPPANPRLSAERWHALLDGGIADLKQVLARYDADGANFLDGNTRELLPGLHYFGNLGSAAVYCLSTSKGPVLFDAPGGPALVDLLADRFQKLGWTGRKVVAVLVTSGDDARIAGLEAVVRQSGCPVVAAPAALERVRRMCPAGTQVLTDPDLTRIGLTEATAIPLAGRGVGPQAYQLRWAGKTVLISGAIPVKPGGDTLKRLRDEVGGPGSQTTEFLQSLGRLAQVHPDLWLPAEPVQAQNANQYDGDWEKVIAQNRLVAAWKGP